MDDLASFERLLDDSLFADIPLTEAPESITRGSVNEEPGETESQSVRSGCNRSLTTPCPGCARIWNVGMSFTILGSLAEWALPSGRGAWCQACHETWRIEYKPIMSLSMMHAFLSVPSQLAEFRLCLVAYLTLVKDCPFFLFFYVLNICVFCLIGFV